MKTNNDITSLQLSIIKARNSDLQKTDELVKEFGLEQDKIRAELAYLVNLMESAKNEEIIEDFSPAEKEVLEKIFKDEEDYKKTQELLDNLDGMEDLLGKAIIQLNQLIEECAKYEKHAWQNFKEIGQILNDEKARVLYYGIEADYKNVEAIYNYIGGELYDFIGKGENSIKNDIKALSDLIGKFESKGMEFQKTISEYKSAWQAREKANELKEKKKKELAAAAKKPQKSFFQKIWDWLKSWFWPSDNKVAKAIKK